jgi:protease IV
MSDANQNIVEKLAFANINEQKARRRWNIFFKLAWLAVTCFVLFKIFMSDHKMGTKPSSIGSGHTAVVTIKGVIESEGQASAERINSALRLAFEANGSKAILLAIESPGGSPVQSGLIYNEIKRLRAKYPDKPVYASIGDLCASGGYYVAAAADKIYADQASLVGSIGVRMDGFGVTGLMEKLGVERRLLTAGENKAMMDPFTPQNEAHKAHFKTMLDEVHQQFIKAVKDGRGAALKPNPEIFSGLIWSGAKAVQLGLVDELRSPSSIAREVVKAEEMIDYTVEEGIADRLAKRIGASVGVSLGAVLFGANGGQGIR